MSDTPKKQRFVVKTHFDPKIGIHHKDIFIDDKLFPYEIDQASLMEAKKMGPAVFMPFAEKSFRFYWSGNYSTILDGSY